MATKRKFGELRLLILQNLSTGQKTVNQISTETGINWKTVDNHLVNLVGKGFAKEVIHTQYVKIFEITDRGRERLSEAKL